MDIRRRIEERYGFPGGNVMVAASHNHAGPAVAGVGDVPRDDAYVETLTGKVVDAFGEALDRLEEAQIGLASGFEFDISANRRIVKRDGTVQTHGSFADPLALCYEGPIDPEVCVLAARNRDGKLLGTMVNFTCHPTHHGGGTALSAGYPGALAREMKARGCPVTVFLNGASGNIHFNDPTGKSDQPRTQEAMGERLAADAACLLDAMEWQSEATLGARSATVQLPFRKVTDDEVHGTTVAAQRFVDPGSYDRQMPALLERIGRMGTQPAEVQVIFVGDHAYASVPAEYFVQLGLRIKEEAWPAHALVVGHANGMVGYVPHRDAFRRGGYETTFAGSSRLAPEAGDMLADRAIELIAQGAPN